MAPNFTKEEVEQAIAAWERVRDTVDELDDVVRGDSGRNIRGLIKDMEVVNAFILKWEKREYAIRLVLGLLSANLVVTALAIVAQFFIT